VIDRKIELLAPSGDMESVYAAVNNGADAIYIGGSKFSARAYAKNFSLEDIKEIVEYCHDYGVKVYVTINTLIKQKEMAEVLEYINQLEQLRVDAVIIQDLGLAKAIFENFKGLEVHASTQMSVHNKEMSLFLKDMGFSRIVLARELALEEIKEISEVVETEVFIHGALCVCYSGQCLMSSMLGGRSGNRGRCAQPCRLPYQIVNKLNSETKQGYLLSPKDICTIENISEIIESGVTSFKIEGRMKRPEYVAGVVGSYRKAIDRYVNEKVLMDTKDEKKKLLQLFNREGFSKGYIFGNTGKDMMAYNYPKNTGIILGRAIDNNLIELVEEVSINDGIRVKDEGAVNNKNIKE
jgi:Collagenase and related proteases